MEMEVNTWEILGKHTISVKNENDEDADSTDSAESATTDKNVDTEGGEHMGRRKKHYSSSKGVYIIVRGRRKYVMRNNARFR